jgi:hypothetical protein
MTEETITAPATATEVSTPAVETVAPVAEPKTIDSMKSSEIKDLMNNPPKIEEPKAEEPAKVEGQEVPDDKWFDKERGFKTAEDMKKSYAEAQNAIREKSEKLKELEQFKNQADLQMQELSKKAAAAPLSPEDLQKKQAIEQWEVENKDSLAFIENRILQKINQKQVQETIETSALNDRNNWKSDFDKDEGRRTLWPKMEEVYAKKGDKIFQEFIQNPFPYLEAVAFKENFSSIAEKIKQEAVEQYKASVKQAAEVARAKSTATPGGLKISSGDVDVSKMSSGDLAAMLPRGQ